MRKDHEIFLFKKDSTDKFRKEITDPNFDYYITNPEFKPNIETWERLIKPTDQGDGERIKKFLISIGATAQEITDVISIVIPIVNDYIDKVKIEIKARGLWEGLPETPRLKVLREIVDCPATDALKVIESRLDFSRLFFNHPEYDQEGGKKRAQGQNYVNDIFLQTDSFTRSSAFLPLLMRAVSLTLKDFKEIGLDVSKAEMKAIKEHVFEVVYQNLKNDDYFNLNKKPLKYQNDRTIEALFLAISKLHIATAMHEKDPFLSTSSANELFYFVSSPYNGYFTGRSILSKKIINYYSKILNEWIVEDLTMDSLISGNYLKGNIPFYLEALGALEDLKIQMDISSGAFHGMSRTQTNINGYLSLWYKDKYKAWSTIVLGRETLFTEVLSFESLEDSLFNKNFGGGIFQTQHMKQNNKQSCSLYHLLLTNNKYHQTLEQTMSAADQRILKSGVATLVKMGLNGDGSGSNGEITKADIEYVFSDSSGYPILFAVKSRKTGNHESEIPILTTYDEDGNTIHGLWDYHFSKVPFYDKLDGFNKKIKDYRLALEQFKGSSNSDKKAFLEFLKTSKYNNLKDNFYDDAEQFANELDAWTHINPKIAKLAPFRSITRYYTDNTKVLFKIKQLKTFITLDQFI